VHLEQFIADGVAQFSHSARQLQLHLLEKNLSRQ